MSYFPPEIIYRIFTFLDAKDLIFSASRVCSLWYAFAQDDPLWRPLCLRRWSYLKKTADQLSNPIIPWKDFFKSNFDKTNLSFLVIGAEGGGDKDERLEDVRLKLVSSGIGTVDTFNARIKTPTYDMLGKYNAILFFSYHGFNQQELGNLLAQYVDNGGGVVIGTYSNCGRGNRLEGRWCDGGYDPITLGSTSRTKSLVVGKSIPNHPILRGVRTFNGGVQSSHGDGKPHADATIIAEWTNGRPLIAELTKFAGTVVGLNFYPPSSDAADGCWDAATSDGKIILSNALCHVTFSNRM